MRMFDEFDQYSESLLLSQYEIAGIISHELSKGEIREDFLLATLGSCVEPCPTLVKGTIADGGADAGQLDIILCRPHAHIRKLGGQSLVSKDDALCVYEIKGNCTGRDLTRAAAQATRIRALAGEHNPLYGVIAYRTELQEKTILNRFGYKYDQSTATYYDNAKDPNEAESDWQELTYPSLDFFVSLEENKKIFLRKYELSPGKMRYTRDMSTPLIKHVFALTRSLWIGAHRQPEARVA
jgi:hypothetical protein